MTSTTNEPVSLTDEEFLLMGELLESERSRVLIGIRHTFHRAYREELRRRLETIERLMKRQEREEPGTEMVGLSPEPEGDGESKS